MAKKSINFGPYLRRLVTEDLASRRVALTDATYAVKSGNLPAEELQDYKDDVSFGESALQTVEKLGDING